jgi:KDO2-lipid IV(A) lauroyltransferase
MLCEVRTQGGNGVIYKTNALPAVLRTLRANGAVAVLIDQNVLEKDGIFVDFFGRKAATTTVAAAVGLKTGCALIPCRAQRTPDGRYRVVYEPPVGATPSGDKDRDIARVTQELTARIEAWVREAPEQWLWIHKRWKTRPAPAAPAVEKAS